MNCPICGSDTRVINSRLSENIVRRRRQCKSCGYKFWTYEILEAEYFEDKRKIDLLCETIRGVADSIKLLRELEDAISREDK